MAESPAPTPLDPWFSTRVWQAEDGLPENRVVGVAQGPGGYLWVATQVGVVRFDGVRFQPVEVAGTDHLFSGTMRALHCDRSGVLWLAKEGGVIVRIEGRGVGIIGAPEGLPPNEAQRSLVVDGAGALWISYASGKVVRWQQGKVDEYGLERGVPEGFGGNLETGTDGRVWFTKNGRVGVFREAGFRELRDFGPAPVQIAAARHGGVWVCAGQQVMKFDGTGEPVPWGSFAGPGGTGAAASVMFEDAAGAVWVGTVSAGLFRLDASGAVRVETSHPDILSLTDDKEGNLWVGTRGGGLDRIHQRVASMINPASDLPFEGVQSVCVDAAGDWWAVGSNGVLARRSGEAWTVQVPGEGAGVFINCVEADDQGTVWVGTRGGSIHRWQEGKFKNMGLRDPLGSRSVRSLLAAKSGDLWIGTDEAEALFRYNPLTSELRKFALPAGFRFVRALTEDSTGAVWAGATDGLLVRISGDILTDLSAVTHWLSIRCLHAAANGDLWIGFSGGGAGRWRAGTFHQFGLEEGIPNAYISQILTDDRGAIWFAGNQGIFSVGEQDFEEVATGKSAKITPVVYGRNEGMTGLQASFDYAPSAVRAAGNRLVFSMLTGLAEVRLDRARINRIPPPVYIESVTADGISEPIYPHLTVIQLSDRQSPSVSRAMPELRLPPGRQLVTFTFAGLSFTAPDRVRFRYQLEGLDDGWVEAGARRVAEYAHPPPGRYRFRVIACNNDGVWNETGDALTLQVAAYFWETLWFKTASILLGLGVCCGLVVLGLRRRHRREMNQLEQQRAMEYERTRIARDLHDDLGVGLTEIGLLGDLTGMSQDLTPVNQERLQEIAGRARGLAVSLDEIVWAVNPANDTSQSLVDYFFPYAQKLLGNAGIRCRLEVVDPLPAGSLNSEQRHEVFHAFKESLNNVIRHSGATEVQVSLAAAPRQLTIRISDNGCGLEPGGDRGTRQGLAGMQARLLRLGGRCDIDPGPSGGTSITFIIPVQPALT